MEKKKDQRYGTKEAQLYTQLDVAGTTYELSLTETAMILGSLKGKTCVDFGAGTGRTSRFLKALGASRVIGLERSASMTEQAQKDNVEGIQYVTDSKAIPDGSADIVMSAHVLIECRTMDELIIACTDIGRMLKVGGTAIIISTNPEAFGHDFKTYKYGRLQSPKSGDRITCTVKTTPPLVLQDTYWTLDDYRNALKRAGLVVSDIRLPKAQSGNWLDETIIAPDCILICQKK